MKTSTKPQKCWHKSSSKRLTKNISEGSEKVSQQTPNDIDWSAIRCDGYLSPKAICIKLDKAARHTMQIYRVLAAIQLSIEEFYIGPAKELPSEVEIQKMINEF